MITFILLILFLDWAAKKPCGYKVVSTNDPKYMDLSELNEYYEQRDCGYFRLLDKE